MKHVYSLLVTFFCMQLSGVTARERTYLDKYPVSAKIEAMLNAATHGGERAFEEFPAITNGLPTFPNSVRQITFSPALFIKHGLERLDNAQDLKNVFITKEYDLLFVPAKYAYLHNNKAYVVAEGVDIHEDQTLTLSYIQQLVGLAKTNTRKSEGRKAYYIDFSSNNIKLTTDQRVAIIDTGEEGFCYNKFRKVEGLICMKKHLPMTTDAREYVQQEIEQLYGEL